MSADTPEKGPGLPVDGLETATPPPGIDAAQIAAQTAAETARAVIPPSTSAKATGTEAVDAWGRKFDPALHLTNKAGKPALTKHGRLICLKGQGLGKPPRPEGRAEPVAGPDGHTVRRIHTGADPLAAGQADGEEHPDSPQPGEQDPGQGPPPMTPEEFERRAHAGARLVRKALHRLGRYMAAGDEGDFINRPGFDEGQEIEDAVFDAQLDSQKLVPAAAWLFVVVAAGGYMHRVWHTEANQERVADLWAKWTGKPRPVRPGQVVRDVPPQQNPQQQPQHSNTHTPEGGLIMLDDPFGASRR